MGNAARSVACEIDRVRQSARPEAAAENDSLITISELAREASVTLRALRFYQSKGLLNPAARGGHGRIYCAADRERLALILQGKRLGFTLMEIRDMLAVQAGGSDQPLPVSRKKCVEQINLLERQRRDIELALAELRQIYTGMFKAILNAKPASGLA
jgi:DNA-binding transcriptional MerR regulator